MASSTVVDTDSEWEPSGWEDEEGDVFTRLYGARLNPDGTYEFPNMDSGDESADENPRGRG